VEGLRTDVPSSGLYRAYALANLEGDMRKIVGSVLHRESGLAIPRLLVTVFDDEPNAAERKGILERHSWMKTNQKRPGSDPSSPTTKAASALGMGTLFATRNDGPISY
jgi:hypothetical protein